MPDDGREITGNRLCANDKNRTSLSGFSDTHPAHFYLLKRALPNPAALTRARSRSATESDE